MKPKKPGYDIAAEQDKLVKAVCSFFGRVYDDLEEERHLDLRGHRPSDEKWVEIMGDNPTIHETAKEFGITPMKVRKLLIMGGCYDTALYREIQKRRQAGWENNRTDRRGVEEVPADSQKLLPHRVRYLQSG